MTRSLCWPLLAFALCLPGAADAQVLPDTDPGRAIRTRADLERLVREYEAALASPVYSASVKALIRADAQRVRDRLQNGDFRIGDRIAIEIQGEPNYPDTVRVEAGPSITLDMFGQISLAGVLRSELTEHISGELRQWFVTVPTVRATSELNVAILGAVGSPGFYSIPAETLLTNAIMLAGGPGSGDLEALRIERAGEPLFEEGQVQEALRGGLTLDQLNLQFGDQIILPAPRGGGSWWGTFLSVMGAVGSLSFLIFQIF